MLERITEKQNLWDYIKKAKLPIAIYGMGDGALKIMRRLSEYGLKADAVFASDGFVRGHSFEGYKVQSFSDVKDTFPKFIILLAFASFRDPLLSTLYTMSEEYEMYAPDVPVCASDNTLFTTKYVQENEAAFDKVYSMLADDLSREVFINVINFKISGKIKYLKEIQTPISEVYENILNLDESEHYVDLGAYNGDTVKEFLHYANDSFASITAVEPDKKNFKKLKKYVGTIESDNIHIHNIAASDCEKEVNFSFQSSRNSTISDDDGIKISANSVDNLLCDTPVTLIKFDVEGEEANAIDGCKKIILTHTPKLMVSAYHKNSDLFALPLKIYEINPNYNIYLRHHPYIPAWETNYYLTPINR